MKKRHFAYFKAKKAENVMYVQLSVLKMQEML